MHKSKTSIPAIIAANAFFLIAILYFSAKMDKSRDAQGLWILIPAFFIAVLTFINFAIGSGTAISKGDKKLALTFLISGLGVLLIGFGGCAALSG